MHVLGTHSFSQRRKSSSSKRPRDLHIRKISLDGCSLSSACSLSSSSTLSTFAPGTPTTGRVDSTLGFQPLHLHAAYHAPPRLSQRPYIKTGSGSYSGLATFFDDADEDEAGNNEAHAADYEQPEFFPFSLDSDDDDELELEEVPSTVTEVPPAPVAELPQPIAQKSEPVESSSGDWPDDTPDYFTPRLRAPRPIFPRSHWSESTIQTLDTLASEAATPGAMSDYTSAEPEIFGDDEEPEIHLAAAATVVAPASAAPLLPNFSYKRTTVTVKRPTMPAMDAVDAFIRRGGWKRRGIVFQQEDVTASDEERGSDEETDDED